MSDIEHGPSPASTPNQRAGSPANAHVSAASSGPAGPTGSPTPGTSPQAIPAQAIPAPQPVVVRIEQPPQPRGLRGLMIALIVLLSLVILTFGSCAAIGGLAVSGIGSAVSSVGATGTAGVAGGATGLTTGPSVAVYHMEGTISGTSGVTPEAVRTALKQAEDDPNVKAVVLRVESGGGEAPASSEIADYVAACSKPVVVSVGGVCASGAYFAASQADWIVTTDIGQVGAIGTYMSAYDISGLLDKLGIEDQVIKSASMKDMGNASRPLTDEEKAYLADQVDAVTREFVSRVAQAATWTSRRWSSGPTAPPSWARRP